MGEEKKIGQENIGKIFEALNYQIGAHNGLSLSIVVCGGTALTALNLVARTTNDVDVIGLVNNEGDGISIQRIAKFPEWFENSAKVVQRDFGLPDNWINLGPASQIELGLPEGFETRLVKKVYGKYLSVYFISRLDQIFFKLFAAVDIDGYHIDDLFALNPTDKEIEMATKWVLTQDVSEDFKLILRDFLRSHNYGGIAERI